MQLTESGNLAANCGHDSPYIGIYNLSSNEPLVSWLNTQYYWGVVDMKIVSNGHLISGGWYQSVDVWDSSLSNRQNQGFSITTLVLITLSENLIAIGSWEHRVYIADALTGERVYELAVGIFFK